MGVNSIVRVRFWGNLLVLVALFGVLGAAWLGGDGYVLAWILGGCALASIAVSVVVYLRYPNQMAAAWDEQVQHSYRASLAFGYWAALVAFLAGCAAIASGWLAPIQAFVLLAPVLVAAPMGHFTLSALRGRAG